MVSWVNWLFHKGNNFIRQRTTANSHLTLKAQPITSRKPSCSRACMNVSTSKANDLERRLISFAATIVRLSSKFPRTPQGRHMCGQILRSGTASAANYGEARGAESRADFIHKLKVAFKELNETTIWLEVIAQSGLLPGDTIV